MDSWSYIIWIPLLPLITFVAIGLFESRLTEKISGLAGCVSMGISTFLSYCAAWQYFFISGKSEEVYRKIITLDFTWLKLSPSLSVEWGILLDPVSVMMLVVITTVSLMVFIYSTGYMHGERGFARYFSFLSLFSFSMISLVLATGIVQMYIFWELVGVSSFLLIGYYYDKPSAVSACKKAFIVTRFADLFFLIGILIISWYGSSLDIQTLIARLTDAGSPEFQAIKNETFLGFSVLSVALLMVFIGGAGKSAMFPLHIWLPDAMEGPTPVSALIHAATMVVAGVYLVARLFPVYAISAPDVLTVIAYIAALTSLFAAVIACTQFDIKRVLAYSTISQIGYMLMSLGVAGWGGDREFGFMASQFHLFTHAMFKALLFLCAGVVIHTIHSNYMQDMGGLWKKMPITNIAFLTGCLAIAGIPPFAGFFSKEDVLTAAFEHDKFIYTMALITAGLTAFYMFRLYFRIFHYGTTAHHHDAKEHFSIMLIPLGILSVLSLVTGFIPFSEFVTPSGKPFYYHMHFNLVAYAVIVSVAGIVIATLFFYRRSALPVALAGKMRVIYLAVYNKFYIDEIYLFVTKKIIFNCISRPAGWFDRHIIDGIFVNGTANATGRVSEEIKGLQSGNIRHYLWFFAASSVIIILLFLFIYQP
ncbi:MAG: NADH-quinone oxidoreductase subunit L [Bacteroidetes bacterium]|nr:NADH-quinone oxidoreductase subunit L [Bacteroidota bacterium]